MPLPLPPPDEIKVYARKQSANSAASLETFEGDVVVYYGATKVTADRVVLFRTQRRALAQGHITLVDADGTAQADRLEFSWDPANRYGAAENLSLRVGSALLKARRANLLPGTWTLLDVEATTCLRPKPAYLITSDRIVVTPGKIAIVHEPRISVLGKFLAELPTQRPLLTPAVPGLHYPAPAYKFNQGPGVTWSGGVLAGRNGTFTFDARTFTGSKPSAFALYTRSFVPIENATQIVAPRTDFAERFFYGYLDSVAVRAPETEAKFLRATRSSLSIGGQVNGSVTDRDRNVRYSKVEAVFERGSDMNGIGLLGQVRVQGLQRESEGMEPRLVLTGSAGLPAIRLGSKLETLSRLDTNLFAGETTFGWVRGVAGLAYTPKSWLRISGGVFGSFEAGDPQFAIDPLYSKNGVLFRADITNGGLRLSYLTKHDFERGGYDNEIAINQVIGCVEAFYIVREYPRDRRIGVMLRVQPLVDLFKRRASDFNRGALGSGANEDKKTP